MIQTLKQRFDAWHRHLNQTIGSDISTPKARKAAYRHFLFVDHGWIRSMWSNFFEVAPGVYRSNQPSERRLREIHARVGLKTVLNLRGKSTQSFYLFEAETCQDLGLTLVDLPFSATRAPSAARLIEIIEAMKTLPKPLLLHCKSGADRTGLAAAMYLLVIEGRSLAEASAQLSLRYAHVANSAAGIQDHILRLYGAAQAEKGLSFLEWLEQEYDPEKATASFARWRAGDRSLAE